MFKAIRAKLYNKNMQRYESIKISLIYFIIGISWISFSDRIANKLVNDKDILTVVSIYKGAVYVAFTSMLLYTLISGLMKKNYVMRSKLIESERRLKKAQAIGNIGNWEIDLATNEIRASQQSFKLYGIKNRNGIMTLQDIQKIVLTEDRAKLDKALKLLLENNTKYNVEFRIRNSSTLEERYIHSVAEIEYDSEGQPIRVLGVIQDITDKKQREMKLMQANEELSALYEELAATEEELRQQFDEIMVNKELIELSE